MTNGDQARLHVEQLFHDPRMLDSRDHWARAGFDVVERDDDEKIMVAAHPAAPGYMFKKFVNGVPAREQMKNYENRVEGIRALGKFVAERHLERIALPQKWIIELPKKFNAHVLVVERLDLIDDKRAKAIYHDIDERTLRELCTVLHSFRGLDSGVRNVPLTSDGRVAFIDTERWKQNRDRPYLKRLEKYLSSDRQKIAKDTFKRLDA